VSTQEYEGQQQRADGARYSKDLEQVEEWNEFGELKEAIGPCPPAGAPVAPPALPVPVKPTATAGSSKITPPAAPAKAPAPAHQQPIALPGAAEIAARNNPLPKSSPEDAVKPETMTSAPAEKEKSISAAAAVAGSKVDHLSAPPSAIPSGTATPAEKKDEENTTAEKAKVDHLSAPPSAIPSGTATPAEKEEVKKEEIDAPAGTHAGSKVVDAPVKDVKEVENETQIAEETIKEISPKRTYEDLASVISDVEGLQVGDGTKVGEQEAKKAEDAVKSVED